MSDQRSERNVKGARHDEIYFSARSAITAREVGSFEIEIEIEVEVEVEVE